MHTFVEIQIIAKNKRKVQQAVNKAFNAVAEVETNTSKFIAVSDYCRKRPFKNKKCRAK